MRTIVAHDPTTPPPAGSVEVEITAQEDGLRVVRFLTETMEFVKVTHVRTGAWMLAVTDETGAITEYFG